jgi:hypothetical protein
MKSLVRIFRIFRGGLVFVSLAACAPAGEVTRVMDGRVVVGRFIAPDAYARFLRGAMAEEAGQLPVALDEYTKAAALDEDDPEVWSRIGEVRCRLVPSDPSADVAFARARKADSNYGPLYEARGRCEATRGNDSSARVDQEQAAYADPSAPLPQVLIARAEEDRVSAVKARDRLLALTLLEATSTAAWDALALWAGTHDDPVLVARALAEVSRLAPHRRWEIGARAVALAGDGELAAARALAGALLDAPRKEGGDRSSGGEGPSPASHPLVARLAVDEALLRRDIGAARSRATCGHLGLDVVAGRALLLGDPGLASDLAEPVVLADPGATGARMVLAVAASRLGDRERFARALSRGLARGSAGGTVVAEALLPFARFVEAEASTEVARGLLDGFSPVALLPGDAIVTTVAVDLAARGVVKEAQLPLDARIELMARRSEPLPEVHEGAVDARHLLFARALQDPLDRAATLALARRLAPAAADDPLIAVALVRLSLAEGGEPNGAALDRMLTVDPADPILAAAAFDVAKRSGDAQAIGPARARLTALARTPRERAHALE